MGSHRGLRLLIALVAVAAMAAACSDDSGESSSDSTAADTSSTAADGTSTTGAAACEGDIELELVTIPCQNVGDVDLTTLPVGDELRSDAPEVGHLYLCDTFPTDGGGANVQGPWFNGDGTFDLTAKLWVQGDVPWDDAAFSVEVQGEDRVLIGNDLPVDHHTGEFPIAEDDPAGEYDMNPSAIEPTEYEITLPAQPEAAAEPGCVSGEAGFLLSGVVLNSPVDAAGRDAVAWEAQDSCAGHPNDAGYHYHSISPCVPDEGTGHSELVGYALDGFGIYGHRGEGGTAVTNADLDECHGHTHEVEWDGETVEMYHYHATWEYPYSVGCFHGTSAVQGPALGAPEGGGPPAAP